MQHLCRVLLEDHLCVNLARSHPCIHVLHIPVVKAVWLFEFVRGMWPSPSIHQDWLWSVAVLAEAGRCCAALSTSAGRTKSSLHLAVLCGDLSEVLIRECSSWFWKVSGGRSSSSGVTHKLKKRSVMGQGPQGRKPRESLGEKKGSPLH